MVISAGGWDCATDAELTVDATIAVGASTYQVVASLTQREELTRACEGIEGCSY